MQAFIVCRACFRVFSISFIGPMKSYLPILSLFGVFLVVSTLQLGKSRTTLDVIQKQKTTAVKEIPLSDVYQEKPIIPRAGFSPNPILLKSFPSEQQRPLPNAQLPDTLALNSPAVTR